ncbi:MAG: hypothetical protein IJR13_04430 [Bacteroidales bacterium]|nr:hypothetical protein [Bacteroidales bacterium]
MLINGEEFETIFDHNVTDYELLRFGGRETLEWAIENGIYENADNRLYHLGILFSGRGDKKKAEEYFSQIESESMLSTLVMDF